MPTDSSRPRRAMVLLRCLPLLCWAGCGCLAPIASACYRARMLYKSHWEPDSHVFIIEEYQPAQWERNLEASGPLDPKDFVRDPKESKLIRLEHQNIIFTSESSRWVSKEIEFKLFRLAEFVRNQWPNQGVRLRVLKAWTAPPRSSSRKTTTSPPSSTQYNSNNKTIITTRSTTITRENRTTTPPVSKVVPLARQRRRAGMRDFYTRQMDTMEDFHYAGQAVDIQVVSDRYPTRNHHLGKLAELAYFWAHFDWCLYTKFGYVHCSVKSDSSASVDFYGCFHRDSLVEREDKQQVPIHDVKVGDRVLAVSQSGILVYSPVIMFLHYDPQVSTSYVIIHTEAGNTLTATPDHLMYIRDDQLKLKAVFVGQVQVDDLVYLTEGGPGGNASYSRVSRVDRQADSRGGVYAPLTAEGSLLVNGVAASCYSAIASESLAKIAMAPYTFIHRALSYITGGQSSPTHESPRGIHWYPRILWSMARYLMPESLMYPT